MQKRAVLVLIFVLGFAPLGRGEEYQECRMRCETNYSDCVNEPPAAEPEVEEARTAGCEVHLKLCYAECENLKPLPTPPPAENNPNVIVR